MVSRHPQRRALQAARAAEATKGAEFHPDVIQTILALGTGWYFGDYGAMYRKQPAVRAVVDFLARNIAQLNAKVYERVSNTDRIEVGSHPLAVLLRRPNPLTTRYAHMRDTVSDLAIYDRAYWRKIRQGRQLAVLRIPPTKVLLENVEGRRIYRDAVTGDVVPRSQLVVFSGYDPCGDGDGVSPLETLRRVLQEEAAGMQHRENMWRNAARQSGFIERPLEAPAWSDTARQRFRADVESTLAGGANAGRIGVLEEGMTWNAASFSPKETEYIAGRRLTYEEVAIAYVGRASMIGFGSETKGNAEQYHQELYQDVLGPWLRMLQDEIELQLLPEFEPLGTSSTYVEFNIAEKLKGSFEEQSKTLVSATGVPYMSVNEARARQNQPRIDADWADQPVRPLNVQYGGQPAVTVPTQVPGDPEMLALPPPSPGDERRSRFAKDYEDLFRRFFDRQAKSILSAKGTITATDVERWDRELTQDLCLFAARQLGKDCDLTRIVTEAKTTAEAVNAATYDRLLGTDVADLRATLDDAAKARVEQLALERATVIASYAAPAAV